MQLRAHFTAASRDLQDAAAHVEASTKHYYVKPVTQPHNATPAMDLLHGTPTAYPHYVILAMNPIHTISATHPPHVLPAHYICNPSAPYTCNASTLYYTYNVPTQRHTCNRSTLRYTCNTPTPCNVTLSLSTPVCQRIYTN
ncbi:putative uncharacterized protein YHR217C [Penaeus monodon]|uniref:putative uncharacterized protein YHR217C n=1 Tax=Penaeus monodon TaxID=6687 RepID=UPI0018A72347|nr:putative uncharacterized protein YHR217C [Penaeus monodon]